jgi:hypothetical protein
VSRIFLSHSSTDNAHAIALRDWLVTEGWDDLFIDLDPERGIVAGEQWQRALNEAAGRCEAVLFVISKAWLASRCCKNELTLARRLNKQLFGVLTEEGQSVADLPSDVTSTCQLVNLTTGGDHQQFRITLPITGEEVHVTFSLEGLARLKSGLQRTGLHASYFNSPPKHDPNGPSYRGLELLERGDEFELKRRIEKTLSDSFFAQLRNKMARQYNGHVFVSHTSADHDVIVGHMMPIIHRATEGRFFIASNRSGTTYDAMVFGALLGAKTVLIFGSAAAARSPWVRAESLWAVEQKHPIIFCSLDGTAASAVSPTLSFRSWLRPFRRFASVGYQNDEFSDKELERLLRSRVYAPGRWRLRPIGSPAISGPEMVGCLKSGADVWHLLSKSASWAPQGPP